MKQSPWRLYVIAILLVIAAMSIVWRLFYLNILDKSFLIKQSNARILRDIPIPAYRGIITDRFGLPLAVSSPVESVWVNPQEFQASYSQQLALAHLLEVSGSYISQKTRKIAGREFVYLKRHNPPAVTDRISALRIPGVYLEREYQRFYPEGEVTAHVVGRTNVDDRGQEGLELAYNNWLSGIPGKREVLKDRMGHVIEDLTTLQDPTQGHQLTLSLDNRIQYVAYSAIKEVVTEYHAESGSIVVLDNRTGEILAMANAPSYNPNDHSQAHSDRYRNYAVTDMFEPGSVIKPFNMALALESGHYTPNSMIDTSPGRMHVGGNLTVTDDGLNYGKIDLTTVLQKSSNIGAAKILMSLPAKSYWDLLHNFGFGDITHSGFPGESSGRLVPRDAWYPSVVATLAYGYGIAVTTLQLAQAYSVLADHGQLVPISLLKIDQAPMGQQIIHAKVADDVVKMLETVVERGGTGLQASIPNYHVAGKTGTAYIAEAGGYNKHKYISSFVGIAPAFDPRLVVAVVVRNPQGQHFGGLVSAPVFAKVMGAALRILDIPPS